MRAIRNSLIYCVFLLLSSCVDDYPIPNTKSTDHEPVILAHIRDDAAVQSIDISYTSSIAIKQELPASECLVEVVVNDETTYQFKEGKPGNYTSIIPPSHLTKDTKYKLHITFPDGSKYESLEEYMPSCPEIDRVYYAREKEATDDPDVELDGVKFYMDATGTSEHSKYFKYEMIETWQYISDKTGYMATGYDPFEGLILIPIHPDSTAVCYSTDTIRTVLTMTTANQSENRIRKLETYYATTKDHKLMFKYSLLVKQHAISKNAYDFWQAIESNNSQTGGLIASIPQRLHGNIYRSENPDEFILGQFTVSAVKEGRTAVRNTYGLTFKFEERCVPEPPKNPFWTMPQESFPLYVVNVGPLRPIYNVVDHECLDCRERGGTSIKPEYWDDYE